MEFLRAVGFHRGVLVQPVSLRGPRAGPDREPQVRLHGRAEHVRHGTRARRGMEHAPTPNRTPAGEPVDVKEQQLQISAVEVTSLVTSRKVSNQTLRV